jgi:hypothetical protein
MEADTTAERVSGGAKSPVRSSIPAAPDRFNLTNYDKTHKIAVNSLLIKELELTSALCWCSE